ncbi:MAG: hypothetical protein Q9M39_07470 [Sulfurovum sp.]|nr:hypothetical protein [Sulfurovum sp.]
MKKILLSLIGLSVFLNATISVEKIEKMVLEIHEKRKGIDLDTLNSTKEPFIIIENNVTILEVDKVVVKKEAKLILHSIMNGKAYINDSWSSLDDVVMGYTLKFVGKKGVVLRNGNNIKKLYLRKKRDNFIKLKER